MQPIDHESAWTGSGLGGKAGLTVRLTPDHIAALERLVEQTGDREVTALTRRDFDHPLINGLMHGVRRILMEGKGAVIIGGLDRGRYDLDRFQRIYWGLGTHLGQAAVQSPKLDRIGRVEKAENNPTGRGYLADIELRAHTDFHELLALACFSQAERGGESGLVSSLAVHNILLRERPDLLAPLYEGFYHDFSGPNGVSARKVPVFCQVDGQVSCYYHGLFVANAARRMGVDLPENLVEALKYFDSIALRPEVRLDFMLEEGEMGFWHNFVILHSRRSFENSATKKRLLLRLWLNVPDGRAMDPQFTDRARFMDAEHEQGRPALQYDLSRLNEVRATV
jgi:hypothetical protein